MMEVIPLRKIDYSSYFWQDEAIRLRAIQSMPT